MPDESLAPVTELATPAQDNLAELPLVRVPAAARRAAAKRAYRAKMKPLDAADWERMHVQARASLQLHGVAWKAAQHACAALAKLGHAYPMPPMFAVVRQEIKPKVDRRSHPGQLQRFRHGARPKKPALEQCAPVAITVELVAHTLASLAFPGGAVGAEGRFNWLIEHGSRVKSVFTRACQALPGADITECGVTQDQYGISLCFVLGGETHRHSIESNVFATADRKRGKTYRKADE